jgi:glutamine---fructose-6-phosphate transaminase (isomerizing)
MEALMTSTHFTSFIDSEAIRTVVIDKQLSHLMSQEIHEQPKNIHNLVNTWRGGWFSEVPECIDIISCGSSFNASLAGKFCLEQLANVRTQVYPASEYAYALPPRADRALLVAVSQSGESTDVLVAIENAKKQCFPKIPEILGIVNQHGSALESCVDRIIHIQAGKEKAIAATKTYSAQLLCFLYLALNFALIQQTISLEQFDRIQVELQNLPKLLDSFLDLQNRCAKELAPKLAESKSIFLLGRGINYPTALEGGLKLKEVTYIHAEGFPAGEFKHGPLALIEANTPVIVIAIPGSDVYKKVLSNAQQVKTRGAYTIGITLCNEKCNENNFDLDAKEVFDEILPIPVVSDLVSPIAAAIPLQLLAYYIALHRGLDPDRPRSLSKAVTTE